MHKVDNDKMIIHIVNLIENNHLSERNRGTSSKLST